MNDGVASSVGDGKHASESHGEHAGGNNMAPPQALLGSGTLLGHGDTVETPIYPYRRSLFRETRPRDCQD